MQTTEHATRLAWQPLTAHDGMRSPALGSIRALARPVGTRLLPPRPVAESESSCGTCDDAELIDDGAARNIHLAWTFRISAVLTPLALLLSWHFELREAALVERLVRLGSDVASTGTGGWPDHDYLRVTIENARSAALLWTRIFNVSAGALAGTAFYSLIDRRAHIARVWRAGTIAAELRRRWRRHRLLSVRHSAAVSSRLLLLTIELAALSIGAFYLSSGWYTSAGLPFRETAIVCGVVLLFAATAVAGRATNLAGRVRPVWSFGAILQFIVAAGLFGIGVVCSIAVVLIGGAMLAFG